MPYRLDLSPCIGQDAGFQSPPYDDMFFSFLHPGRLTWNLRIHPWKRKIIFQTIMFRFYVNLPGCRF